MVRAEGPWFPSARAVTGAGADAEGARPLGYVIARDWVEGKARAGFTGLCRLRTSLLDGVNLFLFMFSGGGEGEGI